MNAINFFKQTSRTGLAFLTIFEDGNMTYTNRRGEVFGVNQAHAVRLVRDGYTTPSARPVGSDGQLVRVVAAEVTEDEQSADLVDTNA